MITIIRYLIKTLNSLSGNRNFTASGRANETLTGRFFQHYGFRSSPRQNVEGICLKQGNNYVSIAESDGVPETSMLTIKEGDTVLYSTGDDNKINNFIQCSATEDLVVGSGSNIILNTGDGDILSLPGALNKILLGDDESNTYYLITEKFLSFFLSHTHIVGSVSSGTPMSSGVPITEALIQAANGITLTTKAK